MEKPVGSRLRQTMSKIQVMKDGNWIPSGRALIICWNQSHLPKINERILNPETGIKDGSEEMNLNMNFRSEHFKPEKQDYLFRCSFSVGTTLKVVIQ